MAMTETNFTRQSGALRAVRDGRSPLLAHEADADGDAGPHASVASRSADAPAERLAYSVAEAALITGLSRDLLYDQMRTGKLTFLKVGRRRIITRQNLEAFLARSAS
jgi:excisionase family DNA binding protein